MHVVDHELRSALQLEVIATEAFLDEVVVGVVDFAVALHPRNAVSALGCDVAVAPEEVHTVEGEIGFFPEEFVDRHAAIPEIVGVVGIEG